MQKLLEAFVEHFGIYAVVDTLKRICDDKARECSANGNMAQAKRFARIAERLDHE